MMEDFLKDIDLLLITTPLSQIKCIGKKKANLLLVNIC